MTPLVKNTSEMPHCILNAHAWELEQEEQRLRGHTPMQNYKNHVIYVSQIQTSHTEHAVLNLFNVHSSHAPLSYSKQESENNLQFMILTYL